MNRKSRLLENPSRRRDIRADFPTVKIYRPDDQENSLRLLNTLEEELAKHGESLETVKSLTIAYPHKHPDLFPDHQNRAADHVMQFMQAMLDVSPDIIWRTADAICETHKLNRSKDQSSAYALTARQEYDIHHASQKEALPFLDPDSKEKSFFVIVDDAVLQGTTVANLMSYIEHNGGKVLMVSARESDDGVPIAAAQSSLDKPGRLDEMASAFSQSAHEGGMDWPPEECLQKFDAAIQRHGLRLAAMTDGECVSLIKTLKGLDRREDTGGKRSFTDILKQLDDASPAKPEMAAAAKVSMRR